MIQRTRDNKMMDSPTSRRDHGAILVLVLVVTVVLALVVVAVAGYTATTLRYGRVVESRADRLASADAAMGDAIEQLELRRNLGALCSTLGGDGAGVSLPFPQQLNGVDVTVNCKIVGGTLPPVDGWALIITGLGPNGVPLPPGTRSFVFKNGGKPEIGGPVYVDDPTDTGMAFSQPTTIVEGDIWYQNDVCANAGGKESTAINFARSTFKDDPMWFDPKDQNLKFDPTTRGVYCINQSWDDLFGDVGPTPADLPALPPPPLLDVTTGCTVFSPGVYTTQPALGSNNYFKSGNYEFRNIGKLTLSTEAVHFGHNASLTGTYPITANTPCDSARQNDADDGGATLYTSGNTQILITNDSRFEISRRMQDYGTASKALVAFQVLNSSLTSVQALVELDNGAKKEFALHGLMWAPNSSLLFNTIPEKKAAALRGGAVIGRFEGGVTAAAAGFVIQVPADGSNTKLLLTAVATDSRGETSVRVVADYRPVNGETAVNSWRVVN
jgi:hypothetical protein